MTVDCYKADAAGPGWGTEMGWSSKVAEREREFLVVVFTRKTSKSESWPHRTKKHVRLLELPMRAF